MKPVPRSPSTTPLSGSARETEPAHPQHLPMEQAAPAPVGHGPHCRTHFDLRRAGVLPGAGRADQRARRPERRGLGYSGRSGRPVPVL